MIRFAVLNEEEQVKSKEEESVEIQAEKCLGVYESAIRLLQKGEIEESRKLLKELIESDLMLKIDSNSEIAARGTPVRRLQYLVYQNYAYILERIHDNASALQFYLKAIAFDDSDNSLWLKVGILAANQRKYKLARYALESCLQQVQSQVTDESSENSLMLDNFSYQDLTPTQWACLETLCEILYEIGDFTACEEYIQRAFNISPHFQRGLELQDLIRSRSQKEIGSASNLVRKQVDTPLYLKEHIADPKEIMLEELSWQSLGGLLLGEYRSLIAQPEKKFHNQRIVIRSHNLQGETKDIEMLEEPVNRGEAEAFCALEGGTTGEDTMQVDDRTENEPPTDEPSENSALTSSINEDLCEHGEKEAMDSEQSAAIKRKRREVEERSGLRTSKRVRDKLEQFEETKRKREEEEQEMLTKYRLVLSKFGMDMENAYITGKEDDSLKSEDIFPTGLSRLLIIFNKHLERPNALVQASSIDHVQQQKTNHFAIFNLEKTEPPTASFFEDEAILIDFILRTNENNSGVLEYLCEFVLFVLSGLVCIGTNSNWQRRWPPGLRTTVYTIVCMIEEYLLEYLNQESRTSEPNEELDRCIVLELQLAICEMYLDEIVHTILHPFTTVSKKGKGAKKVDAEHVAKLDKQFQRWLYLVSLGLNIPLKKRDMVITLNTEPWLRTALMRFEWMQGRHAQCLGNAPQAIACFEGCVQILKNDESLSIQLPNCKYDTEVKADKIHERLRRLKAHQYVLDAARLFNEKDYNAVMTRLCPIFLKNRDQNWDQAHSNDESDRNIESDITDFIGGSLPEKLELMELLYKSCEALENRELQFHCIVEMFVLVVQTLVNTITDKSEATEVWFLFGQVAHTLYLLRETLQSTALAILLGSLESRLLQRLVCCILAVARLGFVNVLHQDRLVDDDIKLSYSDLLKHRPHLEQFNLVLIRVWVVLLLLLPGWVQETSAGDSIHGQVLSDKSKVDTKRLPLEIRPLLMKDIDVDHETAERILHQPLTTNSSTPLRMYAGPSQELYMELIALIHDDLGVRGICGIDNNQLIKLALKVSSPMQGAFYRKEENQCYYCFYGISLSVDGQYPIEHSSTIIDFDQTAAIEFFPLLERSLSDRVLRGQVRGDLKDAVDRVEEALGAPPYESNAILEMNRQIIDGYLASEINFAEAIQIASVSRLPTMQQPPSSKLASVYRRIYAIQGKIFLAQFRNKAKNNQFKPLEDLQHAIDQFRTDIHVNPESWDSWYSLASCYAYLADENLIFSASDIKNNFLKITDLQKRAFQCFAQAVRLAPKRLSRVKAKNSVNEIALIPEMNRHQHRIDNNELWNEAGQDNNEKERAASEDCESYQTCDLGAIKKPEANSNADDEWYQRQALFWFDFGNLVHGILSRPMRMEAMRRSGGLEILSDTGGTKMVPIPAPSEEQVYKFAAFCFKRSMMLNDQNWRTPFMLGKCIEKLKGRPTQVLALYKLAAEKVPHRSGQPGHERIFEAVYKIISTLSKYLAKDMINPAVVKPLMTKTLMSSKLNAAEGESYFLEPHMEDRGAAASDSLIKKDSHGKEKRDAFRLLCEGLARIRHADKRHWHHRPVFRQACILYYIYHDAERAKAEMLSLFQIKSNQKTLVSSVWKPEFERSGKHFIYVGEYTKFLIILAKETQDVDTLNSLARKIRRATGLLLDLKEVWELLYDSYLAVLADLVGSPPAIPVAEVIPRTEFREKAAIYEARMFEQGATNLPGLVVLQRLCELKKLNEKMAPEGEMGQLLAVCYSKLFIEVGGAELYPKELVRQLSSNTEQDVSMTSASTTVETHLEYNGMNASEDIPENQLNRPQQQKDHAVSTKQPQQADEKYDQEGDQLKMEKMALNDSASVIPAIIIEDNDIKDSSAGHAQDIGDDGVAASQSNLPNPHLDTTALLGGMEIPSSPTPSIHTKDNDTNASMDMEPDLEDWKSRKKISIAELASRATTMCKAPPPSLKAPQSLQNKLAGPDNQTAVDETLTSTGTGTRDTKGEDQPVNEELNASNGDTKEKVGTASEVSPVQTQGDDQAGEPHEEKERADNELEIKGEDNVQDHDQSKDCDARKYDGKQKMEANAAQTEGNRLDTDSMN